MLCRLTLVIYAGKTSVLEFLVIHSTIRLRQEHDCNVKCEDDGICEIATSPSAILDNFRGRHATFQYTKVGAQITTHCSYSS